MADVQDIHDLVDARREMEQIREEADAANQMPPDKKQAETLLRLMGRLNALGERVAELEQRLPRKG